MANSESDGIARASMTPLVVLPIQRQSSHAPPASSRNSSTPKPGTKNFSNCSRARRAGKEFRLLVFKQRGFAAAAGHFLNFEFFQPLVFHEPHLEPAHKRHQRAEAEENGPRLPSQRIDISRDDERGDENQHRRDQIHQGIFLNVAFHLY